MLDIPPPLSPQCEAAVTAHLSPARLARYLRDAGGNFTQALQLYLRNIRASTSLLADLHFVEVILRNRFDQQLSARYGQCWFRAPDFLVLMSERTRQILQNVQRNTPDAELVAPDMAHGKVIADLSFGFWLGLTDARLEHSLWVPALHHAFSKAPKRAVFNQQLERLRQLRNRAAHHEPIYHWDLTQACRQIEDTCALLCPSTTRVMLAASHFRRDILGLGQALRPARASQSCPGRAPF